MKAGDNKKIRLFCVITLGEFGGAQQFLLQLLGQLDPKHYEIKVVTGSQGRQDIASQLPEHISWETASYLRRSLNLFRDIRAVDELRDMMRDFLPDTVLLVSSKAGFVGARAAHGLRKKMPGLRVVYRIGGWTFNDPWPAWKRRFFIILEKLSAQWKDIIIVNNTHDLKQAGRLGITPRLGTMLIHNGADPYQKLLDRDASREELIARIEQTSGQRPNFAFVVGTIANFYPSKGIEILLSAAAKGPSHIQYVIIGDGPLRKRIEERIDELGLSQRVFLTGMMPDARKYLPAFDIFVLPSVKEGFPWSILEAMAAKVAIVATHVGAVPEVLISDSSGILVQPGDAVQLAKAVERLAENEQLRQHLIIQAHQELLAKYTLHTMVAKYEKLFTALASEVPSIDD